MDDETWTLKASVVIFSPRNVNCNCNNL